mgnify:CR=1 FL=1
MVDHSKRPLRNITGTCFFNILIQMLFYYLPFQHSFMSFNANTIEKKDDKLLFMELQRLFELMLTAGNQYICIPNRVVKQLQKFYPHFLAIFGFILISLLYFYPVLQGKKIYQSDIVQYTAMAKEQNDFRWNEQTEPYWTDAAFGGMPTYQLGAKYPNDFIGHLDDALRFLPRPADYLFLYFLGFYALLLVLKTDPLKAFFGALAFGFSTYLIIILGVGHKIGRASCRERVSSPV